MASSLKETKARLLEANNALAKAEAAFLAAKPGHLSHANIRLSDEIEALFKDTQMVRDRLAILAARI